MAKLTNDAIEINKRFSNVIDTLVAKKVFRGKATFPRLYNINIWNFKMILDEPENHSLKYEWFAILARDYNVSLDWLILGKGSMFNNFDKYVNINEAEDTLCSRCNIRNKFKSIVNIIEEEK